VVAKFNGLFEVRGIIPALIAPVTPAFSVCTMLFVFLELSMVVPRMFLLGKFGRYGAINQGVDAHINFGCGKRFSAKNRWPRRPMAATSFPHQPLRGEQDNWELCVDCVRGASAPCRRSFSGITWSSMRCPAKTGLLFSTAAGSSAASTFGGCTYLRFKKTRNISRSLRHDAFGQTARCGRCFHGLMSLQRWSSLETTPRAGSKSPAFLGRTVRRVPPP